MATPVLHSPEWWVETLNKQLDDRRKKLDLWNAYYEGDHPLPDAPERARGNFKRWMKNSRSNWMALVVNAVVERLGVQGVRYGADESADPDAWAMYQANGMDVGSELVHLEALINGESYVTVAPDTEGAGFPLILPEHPTQVIVAVDPARRSRRRAAFKKWLDDSGYVFATLYLPDVIYKLRSDRPLKSITTGNRIRWEPREVDGEDFPAVNPLGVVPVVPFRNKARMIGPALPEFHGVIDTQDRVNQTLFMRVMAEQFAAFRQRAASGLPLEVDPETGEPRLSFKPGMTELWVSTDANTRWHEFSETSLTGYLGAVAADVQHIAAQTSTPPHYLLGEMVNLSAEALKAAEAGLVSKVRSRQRQFGESWEEVWRLAFLAQGDERASIFDAETIWRDPEFRTEGQLVDALVKMSALGVPRRVLWERWGASPQEMARWEGLGVEEEADVADEVRVLKERADLAASLIRAGFEPGSSAQVAGLPEIEHTGLRPVTLAEDE